jgi:4-alpha-glucanotransferase
MLPRVAGVLIPLFSLRTHDDLGRGEILDLAPMIDFAREMGLGLIQLLPLDEGAIDETSPYSAMSVFAVDPVYLSLRGLKGIGRKSLDKARRTAAVGRASVRSLKFPMLERAWRASADRYQPSAEFRSFVDTNHDWLDDYALFRALKDRFDWTPWEQWPGELRDRDASALDVARRELAEPIARYSWFQFIAHRQWSSIRSYAHDHRVLLGGDMAFSPSRDSAEVWANRAVFDLDRTVGAPPDTFNDRGQRWGLPLPRFDLMRADGFKLWRSRVRRAATMFDMVRIDHVVGLYRTFWFGDDPDAPGQFVPEDEPAQLAQGEEVMRALLDSAESCELIAEDLGSVPPWVRASLTRMNVAGYKVMQWEREAWGTPHERFVKPSEYPELSLATTGTHDTETLTTCWLAQSDNERSKLAEALGIGDCLDLHQPLSLSALDAIIRSLCASPASLVVLPIQDLFGWSDQINFPGTVSDSNWSYRLPFAIEDRREIPEIRARIDRLRELATQCGRA